MVKIISSLLSSPILFYIIRRVIAGNQKNTKNFVLNNLQTYNVRTVLDVGCGTGDFVEIIPKGISYIGIDINRNYINFAKRKYEKPRTRFLTQDLTERDFYKNQKFDAVLFISMLHHLSDTELEKILPAIKRVSRKVVIVADIIPDPEGLIKKLMVKMDQGKFVRSKEEKIKILNKYFKIVRTKIIPSRLAVQFGIVCKV